MHFGKKTNIIFLFHKEHNCSLHSPATWEGNWLVTNAQETSAPLDCSSYSQCFCQDVFLPSSLVHLQVAWQLWISKELSELHSSDAWTDPEAQIQQTLQPWYLQSQVHKVSIAITSVWSNLISLLPPFPPPGKLVIICLCITFLKVYFSAQGPN